MKASWIAPVVLAIGSIAGAGETGIAMKITGLPALPPSFGQVRLVDLPKVLAQLPVKKRWLVVVSQPTSIPVDARQPVQQPNYRAGNFVACF